MQSSKHFVAVLQSNLLIEGQTKGLKVKDVNLFLVRHHGLALAYYNNCPHRKVPLEWLPDQFLSDDQQFIQCSEHGALFTIDQGLCISGPCMHQSLASIETKEADNQIWVQLGGL
jgi:nitrite reductase/ring-hydroxylating ferredoxin subunit